MGSIRNQVESLSDDQNSVSTLPSAFGTPLPSQPSPKSSGNLAASSTSYLTGQSHSVRTLRHSDGYVINQNHAYQVFRKMPYEDLQDKRKMYHNLSAKVYLENHSEVHKHKAESYYSGQFSAVETISSTKQSIADSKIIDVTCQFESDNAVSSSYKGVEQMKSHHQSELAFYPSPHNSLYLEAKESFANTEVSEFMSVVDTSGERGETSNSCDFNESHKTGIYRESMGSDASEESSSSSFSSALYKPHKANDVRWEAIQAIRCRSRDEMLEIGQFKLLRTLGYGDIGKVYLAELIGTTTCFAMKVMNKAAMASRKKLLRAQTEREILQSLDHPFLPTLYAHFETDESAYLVMEYCPGGDLHALRQRQPGKYFQEHAARFYVAEVLLALEYLHMLGIIYRDLKPENVLVREDGHIMLTDFDLSLRCAVSPTLVKSSYSSLQTKKSGHCVRHACMEPTCAMQPDCIQPACFRPRFLSGKPKKPNDEVSFQVIPVPELIAEPTDARSMSFVGTHEYLAPEIIKGEGHGSAVDWWTFGIFLYELLFGKTPFKGQGNRATLFNVVGQPLRFPESPTVSFAARDLIRGLLVKEPQHRLAYRRGATEVKQHPFFQSVNWALIRCTNPPEVPRQTMMDFQSGNKSSETAMNEKAPDVDVKPSGNYLEIDFF